VRPSAELRSALLTIGNAAVGVGLGVSVLGAAFVVSQFAAGQGSGTLASPVPSASSLVLVAATTPPPALPTPSMAPTSSPPPTDPPPTVTLTPSPTPPSEAVAIAPYTSGGRRYAALRAPVGHVYVAPIAGTVRVQMYQLIDGEVRIGSFVPSLPFFPYITVESADRRVIFRPGALNADTELLVKDREQAEPGTPLFKTVGEGASSWRTFYDRGVTANVIVSVAMLPSGAEVDPVAFFASR
jgi:hypothetical protein